MYVVVIAWLYVALMMAVAEATNSNGTLLGAVITFALYGALPVGLMAYLLGAPARARAIKTHERVEWAAQQAAGTARNARAAPESGLPPDAGGQAPTDTVAPVREEL